METTINQRIEQIIEKYAKGNTRQFANSIEVTPTSFANYVGKRQSKPGYDVLKSILETYPKLSSEWLIHGTGEMEKTKVQIPENSDKYKKLYLEVLEENRRLSSKLISALEKISGINYNSVTLGKLKATNVKDTVAMPLEA